MPIFRPLTAHFGGFKGIFSYKSDKSAILCPSKTETADFVSFKGSIVQGIKSILFGATLRASLSTISMVNRCLPFMPMATSPPYLFVTTCGETFWQKTNIFLIVPFFC